ncbi:MAG: hypothetical protein LUM44_11330 [Pyrinomonadaceae bacterium]|nr:hypothetical protein [Pyrinomonadaceae bacterium]
MNEPNPHAVFHKPEDHYDWDKYLEQLDLIELSVSEKARAIQALQYLRGLFGETFLKKCFDNRHPFYYELANSAPMARLRLIRFAESLQCLERSTGFDTMVTRLRRAKYSDEFKEASTVVETAYKFQKTGFTIIFEPKVKIVNVVGKEIPREPDIKIINPENGEETFVEVSRLRESEKQITSGNSFDTIWFLIHRIMDASLVIDIDRERNKQIHRHVLPYANILKHLEREELDEVIPQITSLAEKVHETNEFHELIVENKIEVAISPKHDHSKAKAWAETRGMRDLVESPPIPLYETHRARMKIGKKAKQLPSDKPGIIVITTEETLLFIAYPVNLIINELKSEMSQYPQLKYVVLSLKLGESPKNPVTISLDEHLFIKKTREDLVTESNILIDNSAFNLEMSEPTTKQIMQAFINN